MKRHSFILTIVVLTELLACKGNKDKILAKPISEIVRDIAKTNVLMGGAVGYGGEQPEQWDRYEALRSGATGKELLTLTSDTNSVVRCYAFQALVTRKTTDLFPILLQHLSDTVTIETLYGCISDTKRVGDFFLETIGNLTVDQKTIVDSLLIFAGGNALKARDKVLSEIKPDEDYYTRIRQMATTENNKMAVVALSKYRKPQDRPLIEALLKDPDNQVYGFTAVRNYPDQSFFPVLKKTLKDEVKKNNGGSDVRLQLLYEAIVQYKNPASQQLLKSVLNEAKDMQYIYHSDYLQMALKEYPATIYEGLVKPVFTGVPPK